MSIEIESKSKELVNLMADLKEFSQKKFKEREDWGAEMGQTVEQVNKRISDIDSKMKALEKRTARNAAIKAENQGIDKELKSLNILCKARGMEPLESPEQYLEAKQAMYKAICRGRLSLNEIEHKSLNSVIDPDGGYLQVPQYGQEMVNRVFQARQVIGNVGSVNTTTGVYKEYVDFEDYDDGTYQDQLSSAPSDSGNQDYNLLTVVAGDQYYPKDFHRSFLEDIGINIEADVMGKISQGMARKNAGKVITGTGTSGDGSIRGINTYANGTTWKTVEQITSNTNDALDWDDVLEKLPAALYEDFMANAKYWMARASFYSLLTAKDDQNRYQIGDLIQLVSGDNVLKPVINGHDVLFDAGMPAVADGALAVGYGDLEMGYVLNNRLGFSIHRNESDAAKVTLTGRMRVGGSLRNGQAIKLLAIQ